MFDIIGLVLSPLFLKIVVGSIISFFILRFLTNLLRENNDEKTGEELLEEFQNEEDVDHELRIGDMLKNGYETHQSPIFPNRHKALVHYQRIIQQPKIKEHNPYTFTVALERTHEIINQEVQERREQGETNDDENLHFQLALIDDARRTALTAPPIKIGEITTLDKKSKVERKNPQPQIIHDNDIQRTLSKIYKDELSKYRKKSKKYLKNFLKSPHCQKETREIVDQITKRNQTIFNLGEITESEVIGSMIGFIEKKCKKDEQKKDLYDALRQNINDCRFKNSATIQCPSGIAGKVISTIQVINPENEKTRISTFWETYELIKNKCGKIMLENEEDEEKTKEKIKEMITKEYIDTKILSQQKGDMIIKEMLSGF